jgi:hypothetical protein
MNINLSDYDFFTFSWLNTSLDVIEKYISTDTVFFENGSRIIKNKNTNKISFEYNQKILIANFTEKDSGLIMIPNLKDGWSSLFYTLTMCLKIDGYHFKTSSNNNIEPYNCIVFIENGLEKRICSNIKEDKRWTFYEKGDPLFFETVDNYKKKLKRDRLNQEIIIEYLNRLKITNNNILEIENYKNNLIIECTNY